MLKHRNDLSPSVLSHSRPPSFILSHHPARPHFVSSKSKHDRKKSIRNDRIQIARFTPVPLVSAFYCFNVTLTSRS